MNKLDQLKKMTTVVADTGDIEAVGRLKPVDCTTNPSIVLKAIGMPVFSEVYEGAIGWGKIQSGQTDAIVTAVADRLAVLVGAELVKLVPGRISTEVDANLSFDTTASIAKARGIIAAYKELGIERDRVLIKLASTWEGIRAAEVLQKEGTDCNLTLLFSKAQAIACADAKVFLISPFVGRILDWHVKSTGKQFTAEEDPGVLSVREIYGYYKSQGIKTIVMGASFRTVAEIEALAGCDRLTISPPLLDQLANDNGRLERKLRPDVWASTERLNVNEAAFRWIVNQDAMATEKLADGIRGFAKDLYDLHGLVRTALAA